MLLNKSAKLSILKGSLSLIASLMLLLSINSAVFANAYGTGVYGSCTYQNCSQTAGSSTSKSKTTATGSTTTSPTNTSSGIQRSAGSVTVTTSAAPKSNSTQSLEYGLTSGFVIIIALGILLIFFIRRRKRKNNQDDNSTNSSQK